jgi:hypothetical protein
MSNIAVVLMLIYTFTSYAYSITGLDPQTENAIIKRSETLTPEQVQKVKGCIEDSYKVEHSEHPYADRFILCVQFYDTMGWNYTK